jgi:hypothetical protein
MLASLLPGPCECTLRKPIPLERELNTKAQEESAQLLEGDEVIIEAVRRKIDLSRAPQVHFEEAERIAAKSPAFENHPFPTCFTCGPQRESGDGLRIFPGRREDDSGKDSLFVAPWVPDPSLTNGGTAIRPEFVWAAMDCPTGFAAGFPWQGTLVTGRLALEQLLPVYPLQRCVITSWATGSEGRKFHAEAALRGPDGELCAKARATWIKLS